MPLNSTWIGEPNMTNALKKQSQRVKIRKNSLTENLYLDHQGQWVPWKNAAWFSNQQAAERFAQEQGIEVFGLFPCESNFGHP
jgi:hypothetical protein